MGQKSSWVSNGTIATAMLHMNLDRSNEMAAQSRRSLDLPGVSKGKPLDKLDSEP
jgi:hypothetical protein